MVEPGQEAPEPWDGTDRLVLDPRSAGPDIIARLQQAWSSRTRLTIELVGDLDPSDRPWTDPFWELEPTHWIGDERIRHLVLSNSVDARDPTRPEFGPISAALAAGAAPEGEADVVLPDGTRAWCDGGPLDWRLCRDGQPVVPIAHLDRGLLRTIRDAEPVADLAADQLEAVRHVGGGARIIAPAGSGKTRVLTERARFLVREVGLDPGAICLVAFNVRARREMEERTADLAGMQVRTLNSLALAILQGTAPFRPPAGRRGLVVIDEREVRRVLAMLVRTRRQAMSDPWAVWIEALSSCRLGLRSPAAVQRDFGDDVRDFAAVLPRFRAALAEAGQVDFDEQILGAIEVLLTDADARATARRACRVMLVDEFQDLTPAHLLLVRLLAGPRSDVFGVGDDDQTIYGYAGASPEWLIGFADLFPGSGHHDLHVNYRCPPEVVEAASTLLSHNIRRVDKTIVAAPDRRAASPEAVAGAPPMTVLEAAPTTPVLVDHVGALLDAGIPPTSVAVLTRVNATLLAPMLALGRAGVPTTRPIDAAFLGRTGVAAALAWLRLATGSAQRLSPTDLETAARRPPRGLSQRLVGWIAEQPSPDALLALAGRMRAVRDRRRVAELVEDLTALQERARSGATTGELLAAIRDDTGLGTALDSRLDASRRSIDRSAHSDDVAALVAIADLEPDPTAFPGWLEEQLRTGRQESIGVHLSTVHRVKGQEWPHVIVHEATTGLFPHRLAADIEEERRVFHVAITRAAQTVLILAGEPPSPFLPELAAARRPGAIPRDGPARPPRASGRRPAAATPVADGPTTGDDALRERLRAWRLERARADGVPAFVVFADTTLDELVRIRPRDRGALLEVSGIGPTKLERYGDALLALIASLEPEAGG